MVGISLRQLGRMGTGGCMAKGQRWEVRRAGRPSSAQRTLSSVHVCKKSIVKEYTTTPVSMLQHHHGGFIPLWRHVIEPNTLANSQPAARLSLKWYSISNSSAASHNHHLRKSVALSCCQGTNETERDDSGTPAKPGFCTHRLSKELEKIKITQIVKCISETYRGSVVGEGSGGGGEGWDGYPFPSCVCVL